MFAQIRARELDPTGRLGRAARGGDPSTSGRRADPSLGSRVAPQHDPDASSSLDRSLASWAEADSLSNCTATYSELRPAPRSTIAAAFSPDGRTLASTHGDHTVKLIDCATGRCLATLAGHRRTPWVVRFHPTNPNVLASGSLDHEVRLWNARTSECVLRFDFGKPIASLAFHPEGTSCRWRRGISCTRGGTPRPCARTGRRASTATSVATPWTRTTREERGTGTTPAEADGPHPRRTSAGSRRDRGAPSRVPSRVPTRVPRVPTRTRSPCRTYRCEPGGACGRCTFTRTARPFYSARRLTRRASTTCRRFARRRRRRRRGVGDGLRRRVRRGRRGDGRGRGRARRWWARVAE